MNTNYQLLLKGDKRALAKVLTAIENNDPHCKESLSSLSQNRRMAPVVGLTGGAGVGKSSLISNLIGFFRRQDKSVAVLAIDPSSPKSGGAFLGDRIRMRDFDTDNSVYIRSIAARGEYHGLGYKILLMIQALEYSQVDIILLETIGTGQDETDIVNYADCVITVLTPDEGDEIQLLKAGMGEIGDIIAINKKDRSNYNLYYKQLKSMLEMSAARKDIPVVGTTATEKNECEDLFTVLSSFLTSIKDLKEHRRSRYKKIILDETLLRKTDQLKTALAGSSRVDETVENILNGRLEKSPSIQYIDHIAVACESIEKVLPFFTDILGFEPGKEETVEKEQVRVRFLNAGETRIELLETLSPDGPVGKYIAKKGGGLHHISIKTKKLDAVIEKIKSSGRRILGDIRTGADGKRIIFIHPSDTGSVLIELSE